MYFRGDALLKMDLLRDPISAGRESIKFRFKTSLANGVMLYSRGTQGDHLALQLRDNRMLLSVDLGKPDTFTQYNRNTLKVELAPFFQKCHKIGVLPKCMHYYY